MFFKSLRARVLAPDVQHENGSDEQQRHYQDWNGTDLDARRIVGVEAPHAAGTGSCGAIPGSGRRRGGFALLQIARTSGAGPGCRRWLRRGAASATNGRRTSWGRHSGSCCRFTNANGIIKHTSVFCHAETGENAIPCPADSRTKS